MSRDFMAVPTGATGDNLLIIDMLAVVFSHAGKSTERFINTIESLGRSYNAGLILICTDQRDSSGRKSSYRNGIYPEYKANRDEAIAKQTEEQAEEAQQKLAVYRKLVDMFTSDIPIGNIPKRLIRFPGVEADDLGAFFSINLKDSFKEVWLISVDGDWDQLQDNNVYRFSVQTRKEYTLDELYDTHGVTNTRELAFVTAIKGDKKDNVIGAPGVGPTRARAALASVGGDIFDLVENLPLPGKQKYIASINELGKEAIIRNLELTSLVDFHEDALRAGEKDCYASCVEIVKEIKEIYG